MGRKFTLRERAALGNIVRRIRLRGGWSQARFAEFFDVQQAMVSQWEGGLRIPQTDALAHLITIAKGREASILGGVIEKKPRRRSRRAVALATVSHATTLPQNEHSVNV